MLQSINQLGI